MTIVRDLENKKYEVDLNDSNCKEDFEQRIINIEINDRKKYYVLGSFKIIPENIEIKKNRDGSQKNYSSPCERFNERLYF